MIESSTGAGSTFFIYTSKKSSYTNIVNHSDPKTENKRTLV